MTVIIDDEREFAKALQDVLDMIDSMRRNSLPTDRKNFDMLEKKALRTLEIVNCKGRDPEEVLSQVMKKEMEGYSWTT